MKEIERKRIKEELNDLVAKRFAKVMVEKINIVGTEEKQISQWEVILKLNELIEVVNDLSKKYRYPMIVLKDGNVTKEVVNSLKKDENNSTTNGKC